MSDHLVKAVSPRSSRVLSLIAPTLSFQTIYIFIYTHLHMCMHTYFTAVNFNICNKAAIKKLPSVLVFPPKGKISLSWASGPQLWGKLMHFQENLCIPLFPLHSWHFRLLMQLKWHWVTTEHNHLQSLSCPWGASTLLATMASRLPPGSTGLSLQESPAVLPTPLWQEICSTSICSGSISHKHSTAPVTLSLTLSSTILHTDTSNHTTLCREHTRCEAEI